MTGQMHNAEASDLNRGRVPLPDLALVDGPANSTAAIDPALPLTLNQREGTTMSLLYYFYQERLVQRLLDL